MKRLVLLVFMLTLAASAWAVTFTPDLQDKLASAQKSEMIPVMISMQEQADFNWLMSSVAGMNKVERRQFVVNHLNQLAEATQANVKAYLENMQDAGKVRNLRSVSIVNLLSCQATPEVLRGLMAYPEIGEVMYDPERFMLDPESLHSIRVSSAPDEIAWGVADIHAPEVWQQGFRGAGVLVGILDTGVNYNHLDLTTHMWNGGAQYPNHGWDFYNNDNDPLDDGPLGHGSHVAGTVASNGTAGTQAGVAPEATIMAIKVWSGSGYGSTALMIQGINFAVQQGCDMYSMSGGNSGGGTTSEKQQYRTACDNSLAAGILFTVAAGNEMSTPAPNSVRAPGNVPPPWLHPDQTLTGGLSCVVTCGATNPDHTIANFSSHGPVTWAGVSPWFDYAWNPGMGLIDPDISAPGVNIKSCDWDVNNGYVLMSGTSMATPHVAGAVALLLSKDPSLTPALIDMYLETYATELGTAGKDNTFGAGLMNILNSINAVQVGPGPYLVVSTDSLDDIGGNNNGLPDPGETCSMAVKLQNVGQGTASNIHGTLSSANPNITITQNSATWPTLVHLQQGWGSPAFMFNVSSSCPQGTTVACSLHVTADSAFSATMPISFVVGDLRNAPTGPDQYGYNAYDNNDGNGSYTYNWVEIAPAAGGPGTELTALSGQDDRSTLVTLPFSFRYYGNNFSQATVCTNGWAAMGNATPDSSWSVPGIPDPAGPANMIGPFIHDLNLENPGGQIVTYNDAANHRYIIEWYHVPHYSPSTAQETFQIILFDPAFIVTPTGDGKIVFQYNTVSDMTGNLAVGIENQDETVGLQYFLNGTYDSHAWPLQAGRSICFLAGSLAPPQGLDVTLTPINPPITVPAAGGSFNFSATVQRTQAPQAPFYVWSRDRFPDGSYSANLLGPVQINPPVGQSVTRLRVQNVPGTWPAGVHTYLGYANTNVAYPASDSSSFTWTKLTTGADGPWMDNANCYGELFPGEVLAEASVAAQFRLVGASPNPFNPVTSISYQIAEVSRVTLRVYDVQGRLVATLVDGQQEAGQHSLTFDGSKLASGLYLYRLTAGSHHANGKLVLLK